MKILVFGNPIVKEDSFPIKLLPKIREAFPEINFIEFDPTENLESQGENLTIIDTVKEIKEIQIIDSIDKIVTNKICSMHDFDLGYNLKILKKLGIVKSIKIIGIPEKISEKELLSQLQSILRK